MKKRDVVIAGAGPSGATAAYYCAKAGLDTVLIDKNRFPRQKPCGGGLCPHIKRFKFIDEKFFSIHSNRSTLFSPSMKESMDYDPGRPIFYQVERKEFDNHICEKAQEAGAEFIQGTTVKSVERKDGGMLINTDRGFFKADIVLGATGVFGPVAKYVREQNNLPPRWSDSELAFCLVTEIPIGEKEVVKRYGEDRRVLMHFLEYVYGGYGWVFPKKEKVNIGMGTYLDVIKSYGIKKAFNRYIKLLVGDGFLPKKLPDYRPLGGMFPYKGPLPSSVCDNVMLLGDAAGFVSPLSGEGIFFAMDSGRLAAKTLRSAFKRGDLKKSTLSSYHNACMREWGKDLQLLVSLHRTLINNAERSVRYAARDPKLKDMFADVMTFNQSPRKLRSSIMTRLVIDFLKVDLLRMK
ncbi:MAG: NAD(P)/FAD-dependent oxidoreductase [Thermoplasmata archaeon]